MWITAVPALETLFLEAHFSLLPPKAPPCLAFLENFSQNTEWILYRGLSIQDLGTLPSQHGTFLPG